MVRRAWVAGLVAAACSTRPASPAQPPAPRAGSAASAGSADPWAPAPDSAYDPIAFAGSGSDVPAWAHDPPAVLRDKINGVNAHVIVLKAASMPEYRDVLKTAEHTPGVVAAEPFIFTEDQIATGSGAPVSVAVKAVDPARVDRVLTIGKHMVTGSLAALASGKPPPIVLGDELAAKLGVKIGDDVKITIPVDPDAEPWEGSAAPGAKPRTKAFRVAGTFHMDFDQYDGRLALVSLAAMQTFIGRGDQVMGIEMTVKDLDHSGDVAKKLEDELGGAPYQAMDWYELNKNLFTAMFGDKRP